MLCQARLREDLTDNRPGARCVYFFERTLAESWAESVEDAAEKRVLIQEEIGLVVVTAGRRPKGLCAVVRLSHDRMHVSSGKTSSVAFLDACSC